MNPIDLNQIPATLRGRPQWVLWREIVRGDRPTKVPCQPNGEMAASDNPATWSDFATVESSYLAGGFDGVGYVFAADDPFCGIDLDGCRDLQTGLVSAWAKEIILSFATYAEISPTETGVKLFVVGKSPFDRGKNLKLPDAPVVGSKVPGIEIYDRLRFFAVTGWRLKGEPEPQPRQDHLAWLKERYWPEQERPAVPSRSFHSESSVADRAWKYVSKIPPTVCGQSECHNRTFYVACVLVLGFSLSPDSALPLLVQWTAGSNHKWATHELMHKVDSANKQAGERGYLRDARPEDWASIKIPSYSAAPQAAPVKAAPVLTTLEQATRKYLDYARSDEAGLIELGLGSVDDAIGGGVERGEVIIVGARPSHGKSMVAMQCVHAWLANNRPCLVVSEEMSSMMLGKRSLQFLSDVPQRDWSHVGKVDEEIDCHFAGKAECLIAENVGTVEAAVAQIDKAVQEHAVQCVIVDYAQLLRGAGNTRYEQMVNISTSLKDAAKRNKLVMILLCQMGRDVERRPKFIPTMSDIKECGQFEQDADVIMFLCWPWKLNHNEDQSEYLFFIAKNRNREIREHCVKCKIIPGRQMVMDGRPKNYDTSFDAFNQSNRKDLD